MSRNGSGSPPGLKRVARKRPDGGEDVYLYAWRGKGAPRLYEPEGSDALWREWREALKNGLRFQPEETGTVSGWLEEWRRSEDFARLAPRTQATYDIYIAKIRERFGLADPRVFTEAPMRPKLLKWRDEMARASGPAAADNAVTGLKTFLAWLMDRGVIAHHVAARIKRLHSSNRADCIWTPEHQATFRAGAPAPLVLAMEVACLTGLAAVDLVRLEWSMVDCDEIEIKRQKTGELALIPVLDDLRTILNRVPRAHKRVLLHSRGRPWGERSLSAAFSLWTSTLGIPRTLHDCRRTAATMFCVAGMEDREVAEILGWGSQEVARIRRRYVGRAAIVRRAVARLADYRRKKVGKEAKTAA